MPIFVITVFALAVFVLRRFEAMGTLLLLLAAVLLLALLGGPFRAREFQFTAEVLGLHSLTLASLILVLGSAIRFGWPDRHFLSLHVARKVCLAVLVTAGPLSLLKPGWELGGWSLAEVSAGGELGRFLTGDWPGVLTWAGVVLGLVLMSWPRLPAQLVRFTAAGIRAVWVGLVGVIQVVSPLEPAPDERPESEAA